MNYLIGLICFIFISVFSSQTLVDVCDTLVVLTAGFLIYKNKDFYFLRAIGRTWYFWTAWLLIIFLGLYLNSENFPWVYFLEFRWFFTFFAMIYILIQIKEGPVLLKYLGLTMLILNVIALGLYFIRQDERAGGIYSGVMAFSQNMGMVVCFFVTYLSCIYKFKFNSNLKKVFLFVSISSVIIVLLTLTRGVWIASAIGVSISAFFIPKKVFTYTVICIAILFGSLNYLSSSFNQRMYSKDEGTKVSNSQRKNIWRANFEIFKDFPILGAGYTQNNFRLTEYYAKLNIPQTELKSHAHNQYLHFAAGTGFVGLFMYLIFLTYIFLVGFNGYHKTNDVLLKSIYLSLLSAFISFLVASLTESNFSISKNRFLFLFFCAYIISESYKIKSIQPVRL